MAEGIYKMYNISPLALREILGSCGPANSSRFLVRPAILQLLLLLVLGTDLPAKGSARKGKGR